MPPELLSKLLPPKRFASSIIDQSPMLIIIYVHIHIYNHMNIYIYMCVCSYLHSHAHPRPDIEMFVDSPTEATMTDRCRPIEKKGFFINSMCVSSALEACLCKGIAFGLHPSKHILWHEK